MGGPATKIKTYNVAVQGDWVKSSQRQADAIVAATSREEAVRAMDRAGGIDTRGILKFVRVTHQPEYVAIATAQPGVVFASADFNWPRTYLPVAERMRKARK